MKYIENWKDLDGLENGFGLKLEVMKLPTSSKTPYYLITVNDSKKDYALGSWYEGYLENAIEVINKFGFNLEYDEDLYKICIELEEILTPVKYEESSEKLEVRNYSLVYHKEDGNWYLDYSPNEIMGALYFESYCKTTKIDCLYGLDSKEVNKIFKRLGWI